MKENILNLRTQGLTYNQIQEKLGCSKGTISYHLGTDVKEKSRIRRNANRKGVFSERVIVDSKMRSLKRAVRNFQALSGKQTFSVHDVLAKFSTITKCYLTGRSIDLLKDAYHFDHIVPLNQGGSSELDNLGITCKDANMAKAALSLEDFLLLCKEILKYQNCT